MKVTITTEAGKSIEVELTEDQTKDLGLVEKKPRTGYERAEKNDVYYSTDNRCVTWTCSESYETEDNEIYENAEYYTDEDLALANARADYLMRQLRRYAAEHGGIPNESDWKNDECLKYHIGFGYTTHLICAWNTSWVRLCGNIYFLSEEACLDAIDKFKEDLLWYFTEYQPMLYDQAQGE